MVRERPLRRSGQLLEQEPENADAWFYLGLSYDKKGETESASRAYARAEACRPGSSVKEP